MFFLKGLFQLREKFRSDREGDIVKPFLDHMEDLRWMIVKCVAILIGSMFVAFWRIDDLMWILKHPLDIADPTGELVKTIRSDTPMDAVMISIRLSFYLGIIIALPFLLYFIADFVLPALTRKEKRILLPGFFVGLLFFIAGATASYYYIVSHTLAWLWQYSKDLDLLSMWTWKSYISFFTWLTLGFGLMCELPLLVIIMGLIGVVNYPFLARTRSYAITIILVLAAVVAPTPDPVTFLVLAAPIVVMYEICIWIVWAIDRRRKKRELAGQSDSSTDEGA